MESSLVRTCARAPAARDLNSAGPDAPNRLDIARTIARTVSAKWEEVLLDGSPIGNVGRHAWDRSRPSSSTLQPLCNSVTRPLATYAETVADEVDWLVEAANGGAEAANSREKTTRSSLASWTIPPRTTSERTLTHGVPANTGPCHVEPLLADVTSNRTLRRRARSNAARPIFFMPEEA